MTLTFEDDLHSIKTNQRETYLGHDVIGFKSPDIHTHTHTLERLLCLDQYSVSRHRTAKNYWQHNEIHYYCVS